MSPAKHARVHFIAALPRLRGDCHFDGIVQAHVARILIKDEHIRSSAPLRPVRSLARNFMTCRAPSTSCERRS